MARASGRTATCGRAEAIARLRQARAFVEVAELCLADVDNPDLPLRGVAGALAALGGIAASDAACCARLGRRSRGQDHAQAITLVATVRPDGERLARDLGRLIAIKDNVHYDAIMISMTDAKAAVAQAKRMVGIVEEFLR